MWLRPRLNLVFGSNRGHTGCPDQSGEPAWGFSGRVSAMRLVGWEFNPQPGHIKDRKNWHLVFWGWKNFSSFMIWTFTLKCQFCLIGFSGLPW